MTYARIQKLVAEHRLKSVFVNLQKRVDDGVTKWWCGYKKGKKYTEQKEEFGTPEEAILNLKKLTRQ